MNTSPSTISAEPTIRIPAWRSVSPMNRSTLPPSTLAATLRQNLEASPKALSADSGLASALIGVHLAMNGDSAPPLGAGWPKFVPEPGTSSRRVERRVRGQQRLRERVVDRADTNERDYHRLIYGAADALRAPGGGQALVAADDRDHRAEDRRLEQHGLELGHA